MQVNISDFANDRDFMERLAALIINQMVYIHHYWPQMSEAQQRLFYGYMPAEVFEEVLGLASNSDSVQNSDDGYADIGKHRRPD